MFRIWDLRVWETIGQDPWWLSFPLLPAVYFADTKPPKNVYLTFWDFGPVKKALSEGLTRTRSRGL